MSAARHLVDHADTRKYTFAKLLSGNRIAIAFFNLAAEDQWSQNVGICFDDLGIHSESGIRLQLTDAITGEDLGIYEDSYTTKIAPDESLHSLFSLNNKKQIPPASAILAEGNPFNIF